MRRSLILAAMIELSACAHSSIDQARVDPVVGWLDDQLRPVSDDAALLPITELLGGHALVGVGEATHGTKQFFEIKGRLFRQLVERHGFVTLAMEMDHRAAEAVDAYLQTGDGDLEQLVQGSYFFFEAREIVEILRWMRKHNETAATKVRFFGFDLQAAQKEEIDRRCADRAGCRIVMRDGLMADNVLSLGPQTFVWAHNGHVAHFAAADGWRPMGDYLRERLGRSYFAIALEMSDGGFVAPAGGALAVRRRRVLDHGGGRELAEYLLPPAPVEALSHRFAQARLSDWFVDLRNADPEVIAYFRKNRRLQSYGAIAPRAERQYEEYAPLHEAYDGLIFFRSTDGYTFPD